MSEEVPAAMSEEMLTATYEGPGATTGGAGVVVPVPDGVLTRTYEMPLARTYEVTFEVPAPDGVLTSTYEVPAAMTEEVLSVEGLDPKFKASIIATIEETEARRPKIIAMKALAEERARDGVLTRTCQVTYELLAPDGVLTSTYEVPAAMTEEVLSLEGALSMEGLDPKFKASVIAGIQEREARRPEIMAMKARAEEQRARAVDHIMNVKPSDPLTVLVRDVVDELVAGTQNKQMQDAFKALAYELPTDFAHDHVAKLFPEDYVAPPCFLRNYEDPRSFTPYTIDFPYMYRGFVDYTGDVFDCGFPDLIGLLGKKNDDDGELTRVQANYHRVGRLIILLESIVPCPENAERFAGLRKHIYEMLRDCASVICSRQCMSFPSAIRDWAFTDIERLEAKLDVMFESQGADGCMMMCLQNEIDDIRMLIDKTEDYFKKLRF